MAANPNSPEFKAEIARTRARARMEAARQAEYGPVTRFASEYNRSIAGMAGAPVDIINSMLNVVGAGTEEPIGGSKHLTGLLRKVGAVNPEDIEPGLAGTMGAVTGLATPLTTAAVSKGMAGINAQTFGPMNPQTGIVAGITQDVARTAMRNPVTFWGVETASAMAAGAARYEAEQRWPDSPGAQALAEIGGGFAPTLLPAATGAAVRGALNVMEHTPISGAVIRGIRSTLEGSTIQGAKSRAAGRVGRATADKEASAARLERKDVIQDSGLTPAALAGDDELLALERSVMEQNEVLSAVRAQNFAEVNDAIQRSLLNVTEDAVPVGYTRRYLAELMDVRLKQAAEVVDQEIARLGPRASREDLNRLAREELDKALQSARAQERALYDAIPMETPVPTEATRDALEHIVLNTPRAQRVDIPQEAKTFLQPKVRDAKGKLVDNPNYLGDDTTVAELRGLQSKLRESARIARADRRFNAARISDDLADIISDDIAKAGGSAEIREQVETAVRFSADLNSRFNRGAVGRVLGRQRTGGFAVDPALTLQTTVGRRGPRGKVETDALLTAVENIGDDAMRTHVQGYLIDDFRRAAVKEGRIDPKAATTWMNQNQDVLQNFPDLRSQLAASRQAGQQLVEAQRMVDPSVSRAAVFLNAPPGAEIRRVMNNADPRQAMADILTLARQDPTGMAERGVKMAFYEHVLQNSLLHQSLARSVPDKQIAEQAFMSGSRMAKVLDDPAVVEAMRGLDLSPEELGRLQQVQKTALLFERQRLSPKSVEGVLGDEAGLLFQLVARVGGAQIGRVLAQRTGGGTVQTPGILSAQAQRLLQAGVRDPGTRLLTDAIQDKALFRALLSPQATQAEQKMVRQRLNAWVADVLKQQYAYEDDE